MCPWRACLPSSNGYIGWCRYWCCMGAARGDGNIGPAAGMWSVCKTVGLPCECSCGVWRDGCVQGVGRGVNILQRGGFWFGWAEPHAVLGETRFGNMVIWRVLNSNIQAANLTSMSPASWHWMLRWGVRVAGNSRVDVSDSSTSSDMLPSLFPNFYEWAA